MGFKDSEDVTKYIGGLFDDAFQDPELGPMLAGTGLVVAFNLSDPDAYLVVDMPNQTVTNGSACGPAPLATLTMKSDLGNAFWQGKAKLPMALAKRQVKIDGNVASLLKLAPLSDKLLPGYVQRLKDDGRDDLII
jgi:SCP-2 sterol transfer family